VIRRSFKILLILIILFIPCLAWTQSKYADPDSSAVQAAARTALANARVLEIQGRVLEIQGMVSGIRGVLQDLNAKVTAHEVRIEMNADVLFDFDKYDLKSEATDSLKKVGQVVQNYPNAPLVIEGHTDGMGTHAHNMKLSDDRAASVKNWLVQNAGVQGSRVTTKGWGETKPVAPNKNPDGSDNPAGRQKNRRVEIMIRTG
jgi:outer membrane protein OmpA-like peptidoglycan-associated protein